jgi:hypothetical protein
MLDMISVQKQSDVVFLHVPVHGVVRHHSNEL